MIGCRRLHSLKHTHAHAAGAFDKQCRSVTIIRSFDCVNRWPVDDRTRTPLWPLMPSPSPDALNHCIIIIIIIRHSTISYRDMKRHNISTSSLAYDMNTTSSHVGGCNRFSVDYYLHFALTAVPQI